MLNQSPRMCTRSQRCLSECRSLFSSFLSPEISNKTIVDEAAHDTLSSPATALTLEDRRNLPLAPAPALFVTSSVMRIMNRNGMRSKHQTCYVDPAALEQLGLPQHVLLVLPVCEAHDAGFDAVSCARVNPPDLLFLSVM